MRGKFSKYRPKTIINVSKGGKVKIHVPKKTKLTCYAKEIQSEILG